MEAIYKCWHQATDKSEIEALYQTRFNGETTQKLGINIRPMDQSRVFELYYVPTVALMQRNEWIWQNDRDLCAVLKRLPGVAQERFLVEMIAEELQSSNEIEGVKSNKCLIADSTKKIRAGEIPTSPRMHSMIQSYLKIEDGSLSLPQVPADIRTIYDFITEGEIAKENLPDGDIFVSEGAEVCGSGYGKIIHKGVVGEAAITAHVTALLQLLQREDVPFLLKLATAHYYFGYIHPFYDGNGRTNRFITSLYLSKAYSTMTAYSFSTGCRLKHKNYLALFDKTNRFNSYGEMNFAMMMFLEILLTGQAHIKQKLEEKEALLQMARATLQEDAWLRQNELALIAMDLFCQAYLFSDGIFTRNELTNLLQDGAKKWSRKACYDCFATLEARGYIQTIKQKPVEYQMNADVLV